jgi:putative isomerase
MIDTSGLSERDRTLIDRAQRTLLGNVITPPQDGSDFVFGDLRGIAPSPSTYKGVWNWDGAFHLLAVSRFDPELARDQARILFSRQRPDGQLADVLYTSGDSVFRFTKPPVLAWAIDQGDQIAPDPDFLAYCYPHLVANLRWWERRRFDGRLFGYRVSAMESGWDNTVRFDAPHRVSWCYAVDLNGYMILFYDAMIRIATQLGADGDLADYRERREALAEEIERTLFSDTLGAYCDYNRVLRRHTGRLSPAAFVPLFAGVASEQHAAAMAKLAADPTRFYPGLPTISYDNPKYDSAGYWRGPAWLNTSYFAIAGLERYGNASLGRDLSDRLLDWCAAQDDALYEYYDSRTGQGLGAKDFGWSAAFVIELILRHQGENPA